ncbi:MAG TPA: D-glycero-beta-D-manno-heptose 1-phosphate adenylyltransferase [Phycisphaerae bacterium]|nr:D-glycero-beta-D-manno-heptose 1-phosphate adenylyltransferase [Phycisphaerae bacterium]
MYRQLVQIVEQLGRPRLLVVGDLILDRYVYGDAERISPEAPIQILRADEAESRLGGAGSVVANLRALGAGVSVFSVVGRDAAGDDVRRELNDAGARTGGVLRLADRPTTIKTRFVGRAQHRHPQQVLRVDQEDTRPVSRQVEDRLLSKIEPALRTADGVVLSDYNKGVLTPRLTQAIIRLARRRKVPVVVDPIKAPDYSKYRRATLLTPNRAETELASGVSLTGRDAVRRAAKQLLNGLALEALVVTLDREGAWLAARGRPGRMVPTRLRPVYDVTGAGDMVISVIAVALAAGAPLLDAVRLANVAGGLEVMKFGVQTVSRDEIVAELVEESRRSGDKLRTLDALLADLARHRARGETVAFTNGCFDLIHAGHIEYFDFAGRQGDVLVVGLNSDRSIRALKGPERPICPQEQRARVLSAIEVIDYIVIFDDDTPQKLIEAVRPDALIKGEDWRHKGVVGREFVESHGGRVVLAPLLKGLSTTDLVNRIRGGAEASRPPKGGSS